MEIYLSYHSSVLRISWDDIRLNDVIGKFFTPWKTTAQACDADIAIIKAGDSYCLREPDGSVSYAGYPAFAGELERAITVFFRNTLDHYNQIHAACIERDGKGILLVGEHGIGKTTLALAAVSGGFKALSDDMTLIDTDQRTALAFPRPFRLKIDNGTRPWYVPDDCELFNVVDGFKYAFYYLPSERHYAARARLDCIVFPIRNGCSTVLRPIGDTKAVELLLAQGINFNRRENGCVDDVISLIRNAPPYILTYSDTADAVKTLRSLCGGAHDNIKDIEFG